MASSRDRQRKLARAKYDRQMARRAAALRRRRQIQAGVGAVVALTLIVLGSLWSVGVFDRKPSKTEASPQCVWTPENTTANVNLKDVGKPETKNLPTSGTRPMIITTNQGAPITVSLDLAAAPCAGASFAHLAGKGFFDNTRCHEITKEGALRCGDPSGTGQGGPTYSFYSENVPAGQPSPSATPAPHEPVIYPAGTVAMMPNPAGANGSQFLIFFKDFTPTGQPKYSIVGKVTTGLDVVKKIGAFDTVDNGSGAKVKPKSDVIIQSLTVGEVNSTPNSDASESDTSPAPTPPASASTTPSAAAARS